MFDDDQLQKYITCKGIIYDKQDQLPLLSLSIENKNSAAVCNNPFLIEKIEDGYMIGTHYYLTPGTETECASLKLI